MVQDLLALMALGAVAIAAAGYAAHLLRLPPLLGYLVAGLALGPTAGQSFVDPHDLEPVAEVGILFLLFLIGLELDLQKLRESLRRVAWVMPFDLLLPIAAAGGAVRLMGWSFMEALALGIAVALSSTLVGERLTASTDVDQDTRRRVLGVLIAQDVAAGALLAVLVILGSGAGADSGVGLALDVGRLLFILLLLTAAGLLLVPRLLDSVARSHVHELVVVWGAAIVILWGYLGAWAGSAELGAFVAGVAAAESGSRFVTRNALQSLRDGALAIFFFATGLATNLVPVVKAPWAALAVAGVFLFSKLIIHAPAAFAAGARLPAALRTAFALGALGEFSLVLAAVATREGLAHPQLTGTVVGAMVILLPASALLMRQSDRIAHASRRLPRGFTEPIVWLVRGLRRLQPGERSEPGRRRSLVRILASNAVLLVALLGLGAVGIPRAVDGLPQVDPALVQVGGWATILVIMVPLARSAYKAYRELVWSLVGLRPGERVGAGRVRALLVDAMVVATAVPVLALVSLRIPATWPVLVSAAVVATIVAALAWRRITKFHGALEDTVTRVLGRDVEANALLNQVLSEYPWGVRSVAVVVPPDSPCVRRTIEGSRLRELTGATVAIIQRRQREIVNPPPQTLLLPRDTLILLGDPHQLARAEGLIVAHGEAVRMSAESRQAHVEEVPLLDQSAWAERQLDAVDVRGATGALVAGVWPQGAQHPVPYEPGRVLRVGDRLLVLGTPLQIERVRDAAAPVAPDAALPANPDAAATEGA